MPPMTDYNAKSKYNVQVDVVTYREDNDGSWPARIYRPEGQGPFPLLLDVHGGAWGSGGCADNKILDMSMASSGLVVVAVELRKAPAYTYPAQVMDVNFATRWAKAHAKDLGAIPDGMGGLGASSGGHTLFLSAMRPFDVRYGALALQEGEGVNARLSYMIGAWPVLDPYARYLYAQKNKRDFLVDATDAYFLTPNTMKEGNPLLALQRKETLDLPPALIIQGTRDTNLPLDSVDRFTEAYRNAGGAMDIQWYPDMPHSFALKAGAETDRALDIMKAFVSRRLSSLSQFRI